MISVEEGVYLLNSTNSKRRGCHTRIYADADKSAGADLHGFFKPRICVVKSVYIRV
jgi:hypothetical protein